MIKNKFHSNRHKNGSLFSIFDNHLNQKEMQNSRNTRNKFNKLSFLEMIINIFSVWEDRKVLLPFQRTKDLITISKGYFGNKLCKNYAL